MGPTPCRTFCAQQISYSFVGTKLSIHGPSSLISYGATGQQIAMQVLDFHVSTFFFILRKKKYNLKYIYNNLKI